MSGLKLYYVIGSPPVRAVLLCLEALGLPHERKFIFTRKFEQLTPEFFKMNPQHTVPTLDDNGFYIWDSHAINAYLVSKYGKDDSLYPKDLQKRAIVDQRLHFDSGVLFSIFQSIFRSIIFLKGKEKPAQLVKLMRLSFDQLESFLEGHDFVAGDNYTIADFSCVTTVTTIIHALDIQPDGCPNIKNWLQRCRDKLPGYAAIQDQGLENVKLIVKEALLQNRSKY